MGPRLILHYAPRSFTWRNLRQVSYVRWRVLLVLPISLTSEPDTSQLDQRVVNDGWGLDRQSFSYICAYRNIGTSTSIDL